MSTKTIRMTDGTDTILPESAESGSGYVKMADGTLIQWGTSSVTTESSKKGEPSLFPNSYAGQYEGTFPISFATGTIFCTCTIGDDGKYWYADARAISTSSYQIYIFGNVANATKSVVWFAIGRWK